jgi:hypothetical protein
VSYHPVIRDQRVISNLSQIAKQTKSFENVHSQDPTQLAQNLTLLNNNQTSIKLGKKKKTFNGFTSIY